MDKKPTNIPSDLQGISQLSVDAIKGTTQVVEALHSAISQFAPILGNPRDKTTGITASIYNSIYAVTDIFGKGINAVLSKLAQKQADYTSTGQISATREAIIAAMNGVLGDHLQASNNPLAIDMHLRMDKHTLNPQQLTERINQTTDTVTLMIHGLCMNDLQWTRDGHNHGQLLQQELGHTVIYLHYNSGLHVSENGRQLAQLLHQIKFKDNISINLLGHSMGGLVARSACYYAQQCGYNWLNNVKKMVFLGTPHHGALLAQGGHWADILLQISPYSAPFAKIAQVRSNGLTDLRHGAIRDEDWQTNDARSITPLPENVSCYAIATSTTEYITTLHKEVIGDGLVSINSALGIHKHKNLNLNIPKQQQWSSSNINHMQLLSDKAIYQVIKNWLS